jgi:hypothetical protein
MKALLAGVVMCCLTTVAMAQTVLENNPTFLKWKQIQTPHFRVLFPDGFDTQAQRVANTLEHIHAPEAKTMGETPRRISVILQNQSSQSNGFVSYLPRRSEFYTMPAQDYNFLGTNDWLDMLASHEYRHVVQYKQATRGINKFIYYLFGGTTFVGMSHIAAPQWLWEGDAVATETAFTPSGRGKIPRFDLVFRTNLLEGRTFNYHKQYLRSYKNNIPDHYVLGYHMVSYLRRKTGDPNIWNKVTTRAWGAPIVPFTFSNALHRETGRYVTGVFKDMAAELKQEWQAEVDKLELTKFETIPVVRHKAYTDYKYPQPMADGSVIAMKEGIGDIEQFVRLANGTAERVFVPGYVNDPGMLSAAAGKIAWAEYGFDVRWRVKTFSRIKVRDIATGATSIIGSPHGRLGAPALSPDGQMVVAIRSNNEYQHQVVLLEVASGRELKTFPNDRNDFYSMPRWTPDGKSIVVLRGRSGVKTVSLLDVASLTSRDLIPESDENVGHPFVHGEYLLFASPVSGIDNIYAVHLKDGSRWQVTSSKYGAYSPSVSPDGKWIYYNDQSRDGLNVVRAAFDPSGWKSFTAPPARKSSLSQTLVDQEHGTGFWKDTSQQQYPVVPYHKISGIVNPYTWGPYVSNDLVQINAGIFSRDLLSTTEFNAGYFYDLNEHTSGWKGGISYQGLYPILDFGFTYGDRTHKEKAFGTEAKFDWKETTFEGGLRIPFLLTRSKFNRSLTVGNAVGYTHTAEFSNTVTRNKEVIYSGPERITFLNDTIVYMYQDQLNYGDLLYNRANLSFSNLLKRSERDFLYRWGQTLDVDYLSTIGGDFKGNLLAARGAFYFPGLAKHHVFYTRLAYQQALESFQTDTYTFRNRIPKPRGHSYPDDATFYTTQFNYALPVWYPDIALGPILNIQRLKANLFYDWGRGEGFQYYYDIKNGFVYRSPTNATYQSVGLEATIDFNIFRLLPRAEVGLRSTYRMANIYNTSGMVFEFFIGNIGF